MSRSIMRGDVYWVDLPQYHTVGEEQRTSSGGPRSWVIVSSAAVHCKLGLVIAIPLTTRTYKAEQLTGCRVLIPLHQFLPQESQQAPINGDMVALAEQVRALSTERLIGDPVAQITVDMLNAIEARLAFTLDIR